MDANISTNSIMEPSFGESFQDFIELATLLNMINPGQLLDNPKQKNIITATPPWHRFKDEFAWLGDVRKGGDSVTAVAGVVIDGERTLLLASNHGMKPVVYNHLLSVLRILQNLAQIGTPGQLTARHEILNSSVRLSHGKIKNYGSRLSNLITWLFNNSKTTKSEIDPALRVEFAKFQDLKRDHLAICKAAYKFSKDDLLDYLDQGCQLETKAAVYRSIRHYIGRLGSWHRASKMLVKISVESPELVTNLTLTIVPQQPSACQLPISANNTLLDLVVKLQFELNTDSVLQKLRALYDKTPQSKKENSRDLQIAFTERLRDRNLKPFVHPEVLIADYIFNGNLSFIQDDRYIGCSKRSCISCHLYLKGHPANILPRPCHGNLWPKWCPPDFVSQDHSQHMTGLVQSITQQFRSMVWDRLMGGQVYTNRLPDSVTGITRSGAC